MPERETYIVVLKGKGDGRGNWRGVVTWSDFGTKEKFTRLWEDTDNSDEVMAEGVSREEALKLVDQESSPGSLSTAALEESRNPDGTINRRILATRLQNIVDGFEDKVKRSENLG